MYYKTFSFFLPNIFHIYSILIFHRSFWDIEYSIKKEKVEIKIKKNKKFDRFLFFFFPFFILLEMIEILLLDSYKNNSIFYVTILNTLSFCHLLSKMI